MPQPYSAVEYANMHLIYGECRGNASQAAAVYRERYPNLNRYPDYRVFIRLHAALREGRFPGTGVGGASEGRPQRVNPDEKLRLVAADSSISIREISRHTGISTRTVNRILKRERLHPFHLQHVQTLLPRDYAQRVTFCQNMLRRIREDPTFFNKIMWSDESTCRRDGFFNMHNTHSWQLQNPRLIRQDRSQHQFKINFWCGILNGQIIGPFELEETLNAERYLRFLQNDLPVLLENISPELIQTMWLQNDGCPAHYALRVREHLHNVYPGRWIGRLGPILWPPRSPDLNPLDFFYWGCLKEKVYKTDVTSIEQLRTRIEIAAQEINEAGFARRLKRSFIRRCRACIAAGGAHFEHLL
ncbi:hypothetical protein EVAR_6125_1 [Eumeta japonica]|uniref:DUF4817 domain-containing protein n=1 Tax=Eumeta variegata TaxID=151549 RepID=A0A4C1THP1_EUMVA|nr:hypothetical protein EVAR_6125_1 [Eumeta japonica]